MSFEIVYPEDIELFGYQTNNRYNISYFGINEILISELEFFRKSGYLKTFKFPKKGDECYFWNTQGNKMNALLSGGPYIGTFEEVTEEDKFADKDSAFVHRFCEKI